MYNVDSKRSYSLSHHRQHREKRRLLYFCYDVSFYVIWSMGLRKMSNIMNLSNLCTIHLKEILRKMSCKRLECYEWYRISANTIILLVRCSLVISYWKLDLNVFISNNIWIWKWFINSFHIWKNIIRNGSATQTHNFAANPTSTRTGLKSLQY